MRVNLAGDRAYITNQLSNMLELYHNHMSICAAKVRIAMAEKDVEWHGHLLDLIGGDQFKPDYVKLNPKSVVPTLVHDNKVVIESNVIIEYLDDAFPDPPLRPVGAHDRAYMRLLLRRLDDGSDGIHHDISVVSFGSAYRQQLLKSAGTKEKLDVEIDKSMNAISRRWLQQTVYEGVEAESFKIAIRNVDKLLSDFETILGNSTWLAGSGYSLADIAYTSYLTRLEMLNYQGMWAERPHVTDWFNRLKQRPSYELGILKWVDPAYQTVLNDGGKRAWPKVSEILRV